MRFGSTPRRPAATVTVSTINPTTVVTVFIPGPLRPYCDGSSRLSLSAPTVRAALAEIAWRHPPLYPNICDETGNVRRHINVFVNADNVRDLAGLDTELAPDDVVSILPAVSGG